MKKTIITKIAGQDLVIKWPWKIWKKSKKIKQIRVAGLI